MESDVSEGVCKICSITRNSKELCKRSSFTDLIIDLNNTITNSYDLHLFNIIIFVYEIKMGIKLKVKVQTKGFDIFDSLGLNS